MSVESPSTAAAAASGIASGSGVSGSARPGAFAMPDNRCCFCLTLRSGSVIVGVLNFLVNILLFTWYSTSPSMQSSFSHATSVTDLDIAMFVAFVLQIVLDVILVFGAVKRSPGYTLPWLCANSVIMALLLILVSLMLFFGYVQLSLAYDEYVAVLSLVGCLAAAHLFSCLVVFQFRKNLIEENEIRREMASAEEAEMPQTFVRPASPPPTYDEVSKVKQQQQKHSLDVVGRKLQGSQPTGEEEAVKIGFECESPPEYALAVANIKTARKMEEDHGPSAPMLEGQEENVHNPRVDES